MVSNPELAKDLIFEILSRTTLETLDACKAVSKEWKQLIYESSFMPLYMKRTNNLFGYFFQDIKDTKFVSTFVSMDQPKRGEGYINRSWPCDNMRILASSNQGILCCERSKGSNYRYYVSKPATRQWQALPNPKLRYITAGVAITVLKSKPLHYKIVRLSQLGIVESGMEYLCEIFDSKIWAWREAQGLSLPYEEFMLPKHPAVSIGEFAYWLTSYDNVLTFDTTQECFQIFSLPEPVCNNYAYSRRRLVEYEGGLGFTCLREDREMELWLTNSRRNYEWTRPKIIVDISNLEIDIKFPCPVGFYNSGIAFMREFSDAVFYKVENGSFTTVEVDFDLRCATEIFQFRSDAECVDLRSGRNNF